MIASIFFVFLMKGLNQSPCTFCGDCVAIFSAGMHFSQENHHPFPKKKGTHRDGCSVHHQSVSYDRNRRRGCSGKNKPRRAAKRPPSNGFRGRFEKLGNLYPLVKYYLFSYLLLRCSGETQFQLMYSQHKYERNETG